MIINKNKTWIESEEHCYPHGGQTRKMRVRCPDGKVRAGRCGIPDTYFSIPGFVWAKGKTVRGFVSCKDDEFIFTATSCHKNHGVFDA